MNKDKQFLFTSGGTYFGHLLVSTAFIAPTVYGIIERGGVNEAEANIFMHALAVFMLLLFACMTEACMMIRTDQFLFAYNTDKALCISLGNVPLEDAVATAKTLYGPVFDDNCEQHFSSSPKSHWMRNLFYLSVICLFFVSTISPFHYLTCAVQTGLLSTNLIAAWILIVLDGALIVNRICFRASIRRFWAWTFGDRVFRSILRFELSGNTSDMDRVPIIGLTREDNIRVQRNHHPSGLQPSRFRRIATGAAMIALVVAVLNLQKHPRRQIHAIPLADPIIIGACRQFAEENDHAAKMDCARRIVEQERLFLRNNRKARHLISDFIVVLGHPDVYGDGFCDYFISTNECPWIVLSFRSHHRKSVVDELDIGEVYP